MEVIHYQTDNYHDFLNNIVMIPGNDNEFNVFYKIIKSSPSFFYARKMKCQTKLIEMHGNKKIYQAIVSDEFESDVFKKIKKTSINKIYPVIIASVVQYQV